MYLLKWFSKTPIWFRLTLSVVFLRWILGYFPEIIEQYYARGIYLGVHWCFERSLSALPFPLLYALVLLLCGLLVRQVFFLFSNKKISFKKISLAFAKFLSITVFLFLALWGFNYGRVSLETQLQLEMQPLDFIDIISETTAATHAVNLARQRVSRDTFPLTAADLPPNLTDTMRQLLKIVLQRHGYPSNFNVQARLIYPKGGLLRLGASGIYLPWIGEGNVDASLTPTQLPFTLAHELAHGYGFGDEGSCNFLAYLSCLESQNPVIQYSGKLAYWRYIASDFLHFRPDSYREFRTKKLHRGVHQDLEQIYELREKYPSFLPFQDQIYNRYLKIQGVQTGIESYSRIVLLVRAFRKVE